MVIEVDNISFPEDVLESLLPVMVIFYAPWSAPCQTMMPVFQDLSDDFVGRLKFVKVNTDHNSITSARHGVKTIPAFALFKSGRLQSLFIGTLPKKDFRNRLDECLGVLDAHQTEELH